MFLWTVSYDTFNDGESPGYRFRLEEKFEKKILSLVY